MLSLFSALGPLLTQDHLDSSRDHLSRQEDVAPQPGSSTAADPGAVLKKYTVRPAAVGWVAAPASRAHRGALMHFQPVLEDVTKQFGQKLVCSRPFHWWR
jgi:hypothetical protein